jgi:hypothetical protein
MLKNIDEKKCWQTSEKCWQHFRKNVDEKMLTTLKNVDEKMFATFPEK